MLDRDKRNRARAVLPAGVASEQELKEVRGGLLCVSGKAFCAESPASGKPVR